MKIQWFFKHLLMIVERPRADDHDGNGIMMVNIDFRQRA
jgi:hypothetical protein